MTNVEPLNNHFLYPGTIFADPIAHRISTVLGSCVAVCMWDQSARIGGINHIMLPLWNGEGLATPKYGNIAMEKLMNKMLSIGCRRENMIAKVFGGANITGTDLEVFLIGDRNIMLAYQMLEEFRIPVIAKDVGGRVGRKIIMNSSTGVVLVGKGRRQDIKSSPANIIVNGTEKSSVPELRYLRSGSTYANNWENATPDW